MYGAIFFVSTILTISVNYHFISFASVSTNSGALSKISGNIASNDMSSNESLREINHIYQVKIGNSIYPVTISSDIRQVGNLFNNLDQNSIILVLDSQNYNDTFTNGTITIDIPRIVLDSQKNKKDENFTVTVDNQPAKYIELTHENRSKINSSNTYSNTTSFQPSSKMDTRKLMIELRGDSKIVRITGTDINYSDRKYEPKSSQIPQLNIPIKIGNSIDYLSVHINGSSLDYTQLESNPKNKSLILSISPFKEKGTITIDIPRIVLDSQKNKKDENFTVTVDNQPAKYIELTHENRSKINSSNTYSNTTSFQPSSKMDTRKLMIELRGDSKIVRITGTEINDVVIHSNQSGQINSISKPTSQNTNEVQNIYIAFVSASIGIIVAVIYFLYRNKRFNFTK